ncbi:MAG: hypothetical protein JNG90_09410 [Planctomycetaceae bacterium]|nr:hypothetical protein [Planctomycetaceae bacterium]
MAAADRLAALMPAAGHMVHMPSHIYFRIGRYLDAAVSNAKAIQVDESYLERTGAQGVYRALYYPHNVHFLWSAMCMEGRSAEALAAAEQFGKLVPEEMIREMPMIEGFAPTKLFTLVRFGKWEQVLAEPEPAADLTYSVGMWHYGQGVACAALKRLDDAQRHAAELDKILSATPDDKKLMRHPAKTLLGVAAQLLAGRNRLQQDKPPAGIAALEEAVRLQDTLEYDEPPAWYYSARQSLGAALLTAGRAAEAEKIYREDLQQYPDNGWSLFGLSASLRAQGRVAEAEQATTRFQQAWQRADLALPASQF